MTAASLFDWKDETAESETTASAWPHVAAIDYAAYRQEAQRLRVETIRRVFFSLGRCLHRRR